MEIQKDGHELIAEVTGSRRYANATVIIGSAGVIATGLMAIGGLLYSVNRWVIGPLLKMLPDVSAQDAFGSPAFISAAISGLVLLLAGLLVWRWFRGWERVLHSAIDSYVGTVRDRVKHLEENTVAIQWAREFQKNSEGNETIFQNRLTEIDTRLKKLEPTLSYELPPIVPTAAIGGTLASYARRGPGVAGLNTSSNALTINHARYGHDPKWADVTEFVRNHVNGGRQLEFIVRNENLGGDPYKGQRKQLEVSYSIDGMAQPMRSWQEKSVCKLP